MPDIGRLRGLYVVTGPAPAGRGHEMVATAAVRGGACALQLRDKWATDAGLRPVARRVRDLCRSAGVLFIVNDRAGLAAEIDADGVHLGDDDLPVVEARVLLGAGRIIGRSADNVEQALRAQAEGADYVGVGPVWATATKTDVPDPIGPRMIAAVRRAVSIPVVAIGGIHAANIDAVIAAGAHAVAVVSAVVDAEDMEAAARTLADRFRAAPAGR